MSNHLIVSGNDVYGMLDGYSFTLSNTTNHVNLMPNTNTTYVNNFTMELWVNPTATITLDGESATGTSGINGKPYAVLANIIQAPYSGVGIAVGTNGVGVYEHSAAYMPCVLSCSVTINKWTHLALVYINKIPRLYVNGVLTKIGVRGGSANSAPSLNIGSYQYGNYRGSIRDFRVWNYSKTPEDIKKEMYSTIKHEDNRLLSNVIISDDGLTYINTVNGATLDASAVNGVTSTPNYTTISQVGTLPIDESMLDKTIDEFNKVTDFILNVKDEQSVELVNVMDVNDTFSYHVNMIKNDKELYELGNTLPSKNQIIGMGVLDDKDLLVFVDPIDKFNGDIDILTLTEESTSMDIRIEGDRKESESTVYPVNDVSIIGVKNIDSITLNGSGSGKIAISTNSGATWMTYDGEWKEIAEVSEALSFADFNNLTNLEFNKLLEGNTTVRFAYYLTGDTVIDSVKMIVDFQDIETVAKNSDFDFSYDIENKKLIYNIKTSGTYSINYTN